MQRHQFSLLEDGQDTEAAYCGITLAEVRVKGYISTSKLVTSVPEVTKLLPRLNPPKHLCRAHGFSPPGERSQTVLTWVLGSKGGALLRGSWPY